MSVAREVIVDLLPVYFAGEASTATRALVEEYLEQDPELAQRTRQQWDENMDQSAPAALPPDLELRSLRRTRALIGWQRWLFGFGISFTSIAAVERDIVCAAVALACWLGYSVLRRHHLHTPKAPRA